MRRTIAIASILFSILISSNARAVAQSAPTPTPDFISIQMFDRNTGWAQTHAAILRTTDGGKTWKALFSPALANDTAVGIDFRGNLSVFQDSKTASIALVQNEITQDETNKFSLLHTTDAGQHWTSHDFIDSQTQALDDSYLAFADKQHGWLMLIPDHGMSTSPGHLYRTTDGGETWEPMADGYGMHEAGTPDDPAHALPHGGAIAFRDATTGWLIGSDETTGPSSLSITKDAGKTWTTQKLPLPPELPPGEAQPRSLPVFFAPDNKTGILQADFGPADVNIADPLTIIYSTHDAGDSWQPIAVVKCFGNFNYPGALTFISPSEGWMCGRSKPYSLNKNDAGPIALYHTTDAAKTWQPLESPAGLQQFVTSRQEITQLDFIDSTTGWAIVAKSSGGKAQRLLKTSDGGKTWIDLNAAISP